MEARYNVWTDQAEYRPMKIEFYDRKNALLKTLELADYRQYQRKFWRALTMTMKNHQTGKSTVLNFEEFRFGLNIDENTFTSSRLKRAR